MAARAARRAGGGAHRVSAQYRALPVGGSLGRIGYLHGIHERWPEASEAYAAALAEDPDHVFALVNSSRIAIRLGRPEQARAALEHARTLAPGNAAIGQLLRELPSRTSAAQREGS